MRERHGLSFAYSRTSDFTRSKSFIDALQVTLVRSGSELLPCWCSNLQQRQGSNCDCGVCQG